MKSKFLFYVLILPILLSCQSENRTTLESWDNGTDKKVRISEGTATLEINYYEDGQMESRGLIQEEKKEKQWTYFYPGGIVKQEIYYKQGRPFSKARYYFENGNLRSEGEYDEIGRKADTWILNSKSGQISSKGNYSQGRKVKSWFYYNTQGILEREEKLDNFGRYEYIIVYNQRGELIKYSDFYESGALKSESLKIDSLSNKVFYRSYFENGNVELEGNLLNKREIGLWTFWHPNGNKKAQGKLLENIDEFKNSDIVKLKDELISELPLKRTMSGIKIGKWTYWNKKGRKIAVVDSKIIGNKIVDKLIYLR